MTNIDNKKIKYTDLSLSEKQEFLNKLSSIVESYGKRTKNRWEFIYQDLIKIYPSLKVNKESLRGLYRIHSSDKTKERQRRTAREYYKERSMTKEELVEEKFLKQTKSRITLSNLLDRLNISTEELLTLITKLELKGIVFDKWLENGESFIRQRNRKDYASFNSTYKINETSKQVKMLIISDTHIGHSQSDIPFLNTLINKAYYDYDIRIVLHAGDVVEGHYMSIRPTSIKELDALGFDEQIELADKSFPKLDGLKYYCISGNHDGSFSRNAFANPVKTLSLMRDDIEYLGHNFAKVWISDKVDITLVHPDDGISENYALKLKQHIDRNQKDRLSRFIFMGHYHKFAHLHYKGIDAWVMPALVHQSEFMKTKNLESVVGGIIMTFNLDNDGNIVSFIPEYYFND